MIFQAGALLVLGLLLLYAFGQRRRSAPLAYGIMATSAAGAALILFPDFSTVLANAVGIGRGADLIFYVFMLIVFAAIANLHLRMRSHAETVTLLARELALATAMQPQPLDDKR
jgi:hypothetical protein